MITSILTYFNFNFKYVFEVNLFNYAQRDVLSQYNKNDMLCPITFFSRKLNAAKSNYKIYNKELLVIVYAFKEQRLELTSALEVIKVLTNYYKLEYFYIKYYLN